MASNKHLWIFLLALLMGILPSRCIAAQHYQNAAHVGMEDTFKRAASHGRLEVQDKMMSLLREYANGRKSHYLPSISSTANTTCQDALIQFYNYDDLWTALMIDSWGKFPDGLITRSPAVLGMYDQCVKIDAKNVSYDITTNEALNIKGRYCLITVSKSRKHHHHSTSSLEEGNINDAVPRIGQYSFIIPPYSSTQYGTCMPDTCTAQQLESSLNELYEGRNKTVSLHCSKENITLDGADISFIVFCSVFLVLMLSGAALDYYIEITKDVNIGKGYLRFLLPFSVTTNLKKIFAINTTANPNTITCLHAMRVMSMCWVVMGHQHMKLGGMKIYNFLLIPNKLDTVLFQTIANSDVSVDSFFFLSGLLVTYGVLREMKKTGKLNIIMFYVHRMLRLTPPIAIIVWFYASVNRHLVSGPLSYGAEELADRCQQNGWRDIVYLSNAHWDNYQGYGCMGQCWYTAVDTQLYLVVPLLIVPLHYAKDMGRAWLYIMTLTSLIIPGVITNRSLNSDEWLYVDETYMTPWCRASTYIVGIWTGYIIFQTGNKLKLKKWQVVVGWTAACATAWLVILGMYHVKTDEAVTTNIIYEALHRAAWAACLAWVVLACHNGYGGIVNSFLSHPVWQPLSRLTYGLYLVSFELQDDLTKYSKKNLFYFTHLNMIIQIAGTLFLSGIGAVLLSLVAEAPVLGLEKLIFDRPGHGPDKPEVKKLQEPTANDNTAFIHEENEMKQLSGANENTKTEENKLPYTQSDIKE